MRGCNKPLTVSIAFVEHAAEVVVELSSFCLEQCGSIAESLFREAAIVADETFSEAILTIKLDGDVVRLGYEDWYRSGCTLYVHIDTVQTLAEQLLSVQCD